MSDPVTNVEIEDVLSSIRRLVSQDSDVAKPAGEKEPAALILTQDHRVDAANVAEQARSAAADAAAKGAALRENAATAVRSELERAIEELEAAMGIDTTPANAPDAEAEITAELEELEFGGENAAADVSTEEPDHGDAPHGEVRDAADFAVEEANTAQSEEVSEQEHHHGEASTDWPTEGHDHSAAQTEATEFSADADHASEESAAGEDAETGDDIDWDAPVGRAMEGDPADAEFDLPDAEDTANAHELNEASDAQFDEAHMDQPETDAWEEPHAVEPVAEGAAPKSAVEALQLVSDRAQTETYDEAYEAEILDGPTHDEDDVVSFTPGQAPSEEEAEFADAAEANSEAWDEPLEGAEQTLEMDEEMLRDMVAEIVRSELQGELGERITRNVRKLVRREINRALAGQDLI